MNKPIEFPNNIRMEVVRLSSLKEFKEFRRKSGFEFEKRFKTESGLLKQNPEDFTIQGIDPCTGNKTTFRVGGERNSIRREIKFPNFRESLQCELYGLNCRLRAATVLYKDLIQYRDENNLDIYLSESVTPFYKYCSEYFTFRSITGSEYVSDIEPSGTIIDGVRHEDLTKLSFENEMFDIIFCLEVMEHISDFYSAFEEIFRCLKKGGVAIFSAPFTANKQENTIRATTNDDGSVNHILTPEYHGDPMNKQGILCYQYFGWEVLNILRKIGFIEANVVSMWSLTYGILGMEQIMWYAKK